MNTIAVVLLAAATATSGIGKPHVWKMWLRPHAVTHGAPPAGGPIMAGMGAGPGGGAQDAAGFGANRRFPNTRSQVFFVDPPGMQIGWQTGGSMGDDRVYLPAQLTVPARYNFNQGYIYRLKVTQVPGRPGLTLYPTIEVAPSTPATDGFLTHNPIPAQFTEEDFDQVTAGNFVTKVIYLPDPKYQELAIAGVETLVSTRLEPGVDPIQEADRRGTILMIVRLGGIDLEVPSPTGSPAISAPFVGPGVMPGEMSYPGSIPLSPDSLPYSAPLSSPEGTMAPEIAPMTPVDTGVTEPAVEPPAPALNDVNSTPAPTTPDASLPDDAPVPAPPAINVPTPPAPSALDLP